jgi:hypothetical protein
MEAAASPKEARIVVTTEVGLNDMQDGLRPAAETAESMLQQISHNNRRIGQTPSDTVSQSRSPPSDGNDKPELTDVAEDPLLKEMEEELNDVGWAQDDALASEMNLEVDNTAVLQWSIWTFWSNLVLTVHPDLNPSTRLQVPLRYKRGCQLPNRS